MLTFVMAKYSLDAKKYLSVPEIREIINAIDNPMHRLFFITLYYSGRRKMEVLPLKVEDINFDEGIIKWRQLKKKRKYTREYRVILDNWKEEYGLNDPAYNPDKEERINISIRSSNSALLEANRKGIKKFAQEPYEVFRPAHAALLSALNMYITEERKKERKYLFPGHGKQPHLHPSYPNKILSRAVKKTNIDTRNKIIVPHTFRHSKIIESIKTGIPPTVISQDLGHSDLNIIMEYSKLVGADMRNYINKMETI